MSEDAIVESSPTPEPAADSSSQPTSQAAPTQQTDPNANVPFHNHPRFRELTSSNRELKQTVSQLRQAIGEMQRAQMAARSGDGMTDEQRREFGEAASVLKRILASDPELKRMLEVTQRFPQVEQGVQGVTQLQQAAIKAQHTQARSLMRDLATKADLPTDDKSMKRILHAVVGEAMSMENGRERYAEGDLSIIEEAFKEVLPFFADLRKGAAAATAATKGKVKGLPPAPRGGAAGDPAAPKAERGKEREYEAGMHTKARDMLKGLIGG